MPPMEADVTRKAQVAETSHAEGAKETTVTIYGQIDLRQIRHLPGRITVQCIIDLHPALTPTILMPLNLPRIRRLEHKLLAC